MTRMLLLLACLAGTFAPQSVKPGQPETHCGVVTSSRIVRSAPGTCDLRLVVQAPGAASPLEIVIGDAARRALPRRPWDYFSQNVCVSGTIMTDRPERYVLVTQASQLELRASADAPPFGASAVSLCDGPLQSPRLLKETKPSYTEGAMRERIEGLVVMDAVVDTDGKVTDARVTRPLHPELDEQALLALKAWQFQPGARGGAPVSVVVEVEMTFKLRDRR
jgi:TonB family protein